MDIKVPVDTININILTESSMGIVTVNSFEQIPFHIYGPDDLVAFDLNNVLYMENFRTLSPDINQMIRCNHKYKQMFFTEHKQSGGMTAVNLLYKGFEYIPTEPNISETLQQLTVPTIGFTSKRTGYATVKDTQRTEDEILMVLQQMDLKFTAQLCDVTTKGMNTSNPKFAKYATIPHLRPYYKPGSMMIKDNIIFCNNINKGYVLGILLPRWQINHAYQPHIFVMVDDKLTNLESVKVAIETYNSKCRYNVPIIFHGYHYI
jgi:hypothetical protein